MEEENSNTPRIILTGIIVVFLGCAIWLFVSRQNISALNRQLDQSKLKYEAMLSEKLLQEKDYEKERKKRESFESKTIELKDALEMKTKMVTTQTAENRRIQKALHFADKQLNEERAAYEAKFKSAAQNNTELEFLSQTKSDSIEHLLAELSILKSDLDAAISRSIDQTLVVAEKRNGKVTSKSRKVKELTAQVAVPYKLNDLSFVVEGPDGSVLSTNGSLTARQIAEEQYATASTEDVLFSGNKTKTMEVVYKPDEKLEPGTYVFKIYNGQDYIGSMQAVLR